MLSLSWLLSSSLSLSPYRFNFQHLVECGCSNLDVWSLNEVFYKFWSDWCFPCWITIWHEGFFKDLTCLVNSQLKFAKMHVFKLSTNIGMAVMVVMIMSFQLDQWHELPSLSISSLIGHLMVSQDFCLSNQCFDLIYFQEAGKGSQGVLNKSNWRLCIQ